MLSKTIMSGIGGQGILFSGLALSWAAMHEGSYVTYLPAYGAEMRGGITSCTVAISDEEIASPVASCPNHLVIMDNQSLLRLQDQVRPGGAILLNSSLVIDRPLRTDITLIELPVGKIAEESVGIRYANMVMLGGFIKYTGLVDARTLTENMAEILGPAKARFKDNNIAAMEAGMKMLG